MEEKENEGDQQSLSYRHICFRCQFLSKILTKLFLDNSSETSMKDQDLYINLETIDNFKKMTKFMGIINQIIKSNILKFLTNYDYIKLFVHTLNKIKNPKKALKYLF